MFSLSQSDDPTKKGAKIQNEYMFLLRCIMATSWIGNLYFSRRNVCFELADNTFVLLVESITKVPNKYKCVLCHYKLLFIFIYFKVFTFYIYSCTGWMLLPKRYRFISFLIKIFVEMAEKQITGMMMTWMCRKSQAG